MPNPQYKTTENVLARELGDELVIYLRSSGASVHLNTSAAVIWYSCEGGQTRDKILEALVETYPSVQADRLNRELDATLEQLQSAGVIEVLP